MKFLLALYIICFLSFSDADDRLTTSNFIKNLLLQFQKGLLTIPDCVTENCPQVRSIDCQSRKSNGLQFTTQVIQGVGKCQSNANGVCGNSINRISIQGLALQISDTPLIICRADKDDSYVYNADQVEITRTYENLQNERGLKRRWYESSWNNVQYKGNFSCYQYGCDNTPVFLKPSFSMQLQIKIIAKVLSALALFQEDCVDDSDLNWIQYSNATVSVNTFNTFCNPDALKTLEGNLFNSLKGNYFGYILGTRFTNLVSNALISKLRTCNQGTSSIC